MNNSHSNSPTPCQLKITVGQGVLYPLDFLTVIQDATSLAELKVVACVWGYDAIVGIETEKLTFTDIQQRTGLTNKSTSDGIKRALDKVYIVYLEENGTRYFLPPEKSIPHVHDHVFKPMDILSSSLTNNHEHEEKSKPRQKVYQTLLEEFGMVKSVRIAQDIALTPKYTIERLEQQIRYTRWEVQHGEDGNHQKLIRNAAGRLVHRIKNNLPQPKGFDLVEALEADGWTRDKLYSAVERGEIAPHLKDTMGYASWEQQRLEYAEVA